jgi:hypothetical protein
MDEILDPHTKGSPPHELFATIALSPTTTTASAAIRRTSSCPWPAWSTMHRGPLVLPPHSTTSPRRRSWRGMVQACELGKDDVTSWWRRPWRGWRRRATYSLTVAHPDGTGLGSDGGVSRRWWPQREWRGCRVDHRAATMRWGRLGGKEEEGKEEGYDTWDPRVSEWGVEV